MFSAADRGAAILAARLRMLADQGNGVRRAADRAAGGLAPDDLCESADALAELIGSAHMVLRVLVERAEAAALHLPPAAPALVRLTTLSTASGIPVDQTVSIWPAATTTIAAQGHPIT